MKKLELLIDPDDSLYVTRNKLKAFAGQVRDEIKHNEKQIEIQEQKEKNKSQTNILDQINEQGKTDGSSKNSV